MAGEYIAIFLMCALTSLLFFGGWLSPIPGLPDGVFWMVAKMAFFFFIFAMVKAITPRYRYDQLMRIGWKVFLPLSLAWVVIVCVPREIRSPRRRLGPLGRGGVSMDQTADIARTDLMDHLRETIVAECLADRRTLVVDRVKASDGSDPHDPRRLRRGVLGPVDAQDAMPERTKCGG